MTFLGHEPVHCTADRERRGSYRSPIISYLPDGQQMVSCTGNGTIRIWDLQAGTELEEARIVCGQGEKVVEISRDARWVTTVARGDPNGRKLKAYEVKKGIVKTLTGHSQVITCTDISPDGNLLASGSWDFTSRIWSLDTGKVVAGPFKSADWVGSVRFSQNSKKLAVRSSAVKCLEVWDVEEQTLDIRVGKHSTFGPAEKSPMFWTTKGKTIVAAFNFLDNHHSARTIYEFNATTLKTVGAPFDDSESKPISCLALSFDCALLVSASFIGSDIKLWDFESRQLLASFNIKNSSSLILSPDARSVAYAIYGSTGSPFKIHICDIPHEIVADIWPSQEARSTNAKNTDISDPLKSDAICPVAIRRDPTTVSFATQPLRHSPAGIHEEKLTILRQFRKLLLCPFRKDAVPLDRTMERCSPLDCPSTLPRLLNISSLTPPTMVLSIPGERARHSTALSTPTTIRSCFELGHSSRTCTSTSCQCSSCAAQKKERNAVAHAPKENDGYRGDEEFDFPPSATSDPQRASAPARVSSGRHESGRSFLLIE